MNLRIIERIPSSQILLTIVHLTLPPPIPPQEEFLWFVSWFLWRIATVTWKIISTLVPERIPLVAQRFTVKWFSWNEHKRSTRFSWSAPAVVVDVPSRIYVMKCRPGSIPYASNRGSGKSTRPGTKNSVYQEGRRLPYWLCMLFGQDVIWSGRVFLQCQVTLELGRLVVLGK